MSPAALAWQQFRLERKLFWRNPSAAFFSFVLPLLLLLLVASVFCQATNDELEMLIPGIAGLSIMATTFNALAFNLTFLREQGILKRLRARPMPHGVLPRGVPGQRRGQRLRAGGAGGGDRPPALRRELAARLARADRVHAARALPRSARWESPSRTRSRTSTRAAAYMNAIFLPVMFVSGIFYSSESASARARGRRRALPLKHVVDGLSGAIVGGAGVVDNLGGRP